MTLLITLLMTGGYLFAQQIEWGEKNKAKSKNYQPIILMDDGESIYTTYFDAHHADIERHSIKGVLVYSTSIELGKIGNNYPEIEYVGYLNDKFVLFASYYNASNDTATLYSYSYCGKTGIQTGEETKLFAVPAVKNWSRGNFTFIPSQDQSKIMINTTVTKGNSGKITDCFKLFDSNMNMLMERDEIVYGKEVDYTNQNFTVDSGGSIYFVRKKSEGQFFMVEYDAAKKWAKWEEVIDASKTDKNLSVTGVAFGFDSNLDLIITGICTATHKGITKPVGAMYMKVDRLSKDVKIFKTYTFDTFRKMGGFSFTNPSMHFTKGNNLVFISECQSEMQYKNSTMYMEGDLALASFATEGELLWSNSIQKIQIYSNAAVIPFTVAMSNAQYFSYVSGISGNNLFVFFNNNPMNLTRQDGEKGPSVMPFSKTIPMLNTINLTDGKIVYKQFFDPKEANTYLKIRGSYPMSNSSDIIALAQYKGIYQFVRIKLEE
ncbi:hypothetical protein [Williamwhitmania taraxaci]|nr:hypothetical protein [Williamwhitmania taraxaci]